MDYPELQTPMMLINKELHIPLKQLNNSNKQTPASCHALLNNKWISHLRDTSEYSTPPCIDLEEEAIKCFLMPSVLTNLPQCWNSFIITVVDKQQLESNHVCAPDSVDSIFTNLIQLKVNLKLRDRQLLANCYSSAPTNSYSQRTHYIDRKFLEYHFCCNIIKVPVLIHDCDFTQNTPPLNTPLSPSHILHTYFILETEEHFYFLHPHSKVSLLDAVKYSHSLLTSCRIKSLFLLYQLKYCIENMSDSLTNWSYLTLASFYTDKNLWLYTTGVAAPLPNTLLEDKRRDDITTSKASTLGDSTRLWQECRISNLDYLMLINESAGRKEGDPNNHPFLPWVSDFKSPDLKSRDFTKSKYRLTKGDAQLDFTYTSPTYSSSLLEAKLEPHHVTDTFSEITYFIYLARRTPRSILCRYVRPRWEPSEYPTSVTRIQEWTPDECIPEFFSDPSVFRSIHPDLPDLKVPDWCDSPESFVAWHRKVLESDHVSNNLHNWIDLYFGYKLTGEAAFKAKNIQHFLIRKHSSPYNYGVNQLFKEPHPRRHVSNYLHQYYTGRDVKLSAEQEVIYDDFENKIHKSSIISIEHNNTANNQPVDTAIDADANEHGLYSSCQIDHFDVVHAPPADFTEPLIRKPDESKRGFPDFDTPKKHFLPFNRFRGKEVLDETQILKYRSNISLPSNLDLGRLLDEFDKENLFYSNQYPVSQESSDPQPLNRNGHRLLYQASYSLQQTQVVLVVLCLEFLTSGLLKCYSYTAPLSERATLLRANLKDNQMHDIPEANRLLVLLDRYINNSSLLNSATVEFPLQFPSYFETLHVFLSRLYSHKNRLFSLSHLEARKIFRTSDYSPILSLIQSDSSELLSRIPQEGLHLVGDYCKWLFTDSLLAPLAFLKTFSSIATYLPITYLLNNYTSCIQKVYCDLKDHTLYPFLLESSFVTSIINLFGPNCFFSFLLKYLLKPIMSPHCTSPVSISLLSDSLSQLHKQRETTPDKPLERPYISIVESDTEVSDLLNDTASSLIASDTFIFLFSYFGISVSTKFLLSELVGLLPDYSCKVFAHITSFESFRDVFLHDTCYVTINSILTLANDKYANFICFHYVTSWVAQIQKRALNIRTEGVLSAILVLANIWLLSVTNESIQTSLYRFFKDIVDVLYQVISSTATLFTRGVDFRYHLHIVLLHLITQIISSDPTGVYPYNVSLVKTAVVKIFDAFSAIQNIRETEISDKTDNVAANKQYRINAQLFTTFNADLLAQFSASCYTFLQDNDIDIPSFVTQVTSNSKKVKPVFAYRTELRDLVSLFYSNDTNLYNKRPKSLSSRPASTSFSREDKFVLDKFTISPFSSLPPSSPHNHSTKYNWIDYLKQVHEISNEPKIFTHLQSLYGTDTAISKLCYTPCENVIFGSSKEQILVWRVCESPMQSDIKVNSVYRSHNKAVKSLSYSACLDSVVSNDGCIHIWNVESMNILYKHAYQSKLHQIHCSSPQTPRVIYSATSESTLTVLDTRVPRLVFDWMVPSSMPSAFHHICVTSDDKTIYLTTSSGSIIMVDTRMGHILGQWSVSDTDISSMLLHHNQFFCASSDNTLRIFSQRGQLYQSIGCRTQTDYIDALTDSAVICSSCSDTAVTLFQRQDTWNPIHKWPIPKLNNSSVNSIAFLPLQQVLLASLEAGVVHVYGTNFSHIVANLK